MFFPHYNSESYSHSVVLVRGERNQVGVAKSALRPQVCTDAFTYADIVWSQSVFPMSPGWHIRGQLIQVKVDKKDEGQILDERNPEVSRLIDIIYVDQFEPAEKY